MITNKPAVDVTGISFAREQNPVFIDFSVTIPHGQHLALLGTNGSGKSTLLDLIAGTLKPAHGTITRADDRYSFVPQRSALNEHIPMTVWNAVAMGLWGTKRLWSFTTPRERALVRERIDQLGLTQIAGKQLSQLSDGQRQRVLIAQALVHDAPLILLDEPEAGLDTQAREIIQHALRAEAQRGTTVIIATHELDSARAADRCVVLKGEAGGIIADGTPEQVLTDATLAQAFT